MRREALMPVLAAAIAGLIAAQPAQAQEAESKTMTAEVVDMTCYLNMGVKGAAHKECAVMCANAGLQLGLLGSDGQLYLPSGQGMPAADMNPELVKFAEEKVEVTGVVHERSGARSIVIEKIAKSGY